MIQTSFAPDFVSVQKEFGIGYRCIDGSVCAELIEQLIAGVEPNVRGDPGTPIQGVGLRTLHQAGIGYQKGMTEPYIAINPRLLRIWSARRQEISHAGKQTCIDRRTVQIHDADDATHD